MHRSDVGGRSVWSRDSGEGISSFASLNELTGEDRSEQVAHLICQRSRVVVPHVDVGLAEPDSDLITAAVRDVARGGATGGGCDLDSPDPGVSVDSFVDRRGVFGVTVQRFVHGCTEGNAVRLEVIVEHTFSMPHAGARGPSPLVLGPQVTATCQRSGQASASPDSCRRQVRCGAGQGSRSDRLRRPEAALDACRAGPHFQ